MTAQPAAPAPQHGQAPEVEPPAVSCVIAVGANLGDRRATIAAAVREIADLDGVELAGVSDLIESVALKPEGRDAAAPAYLNGVLTVDTTLTPDALLDRLNAIEAAHGRVREQHWGDRTLDLDIIDFGGLQRDDARLTLPHPRAHERDFVLQPWLQLQPDAEIAGRGRVDRLLAALGVGATSAAHPAAQPASPLGDRS